VLQKSATSVLLRQELMVKQANFALSRVRGAALVAEGRALRDEIDRLATALQVERRHRPLVHRPYWPLGQGQAGPTFASKRGRGAQLDTPPRQRGAKERRVVTA
jgi:hypothetical protein